MANNDNTQGVSHVISTLPSVPAGNAIRQLAEPMAVGLQRDGVEAGNVKLAVYELDRLTILVSFINPPVEVCLGGRGASRFKKYCLLQ